VNPGSQIYSWRQQLDKIGTANPVKKFMSRGMKVLYEHYPLYDTGLKFAPLINKLPWAIVGNPKLNPWCVGHDTPKFAKESFHELWKKGKVK
jgi:L-lactate dehydrogenase complex protein LldF